MSQGETPAHRELKRLALEWARAQGLVIAAAEVRVPKSGYRADAVACAPLRRTKVGEGSMRGGEVGWGGDSLAGKTAVFECKQARADLRKDAHDDAVVRERLAALLGRRAELEAMLAVHRPDLRRGEALWPEFDAWDFSGLEHKAYRELLVKIAMLQGRVKAGTKFSKMLRYRSADFLYLVVEDDIYAEAEIPAGWGLLVRRGEALELRRKPAALDAAPAQRLALLEAIALKATRVVKRRELTDEGNGTSGVGSRLKPNPGSLTTNGSE